ncbi:MAG: ParA family protein [Syntrophomonadaceae bacterium]|nr:ParA family protein [Syntrophomonadaceae bacterium]
MEANTRIVEAYIGEYASGKSETAINRALELSNQGRRVTLVDLDTVEPFYTLRPIKNQLEKLNLNVIGYSREDSFGLGETGAMMNPRARWALRNEGDIILDIGYGVFGAQTLNLIEDIDQTPELKVIAVVNASRPMTNSLDRILEYVKGLGRVDAIVANTHMGDETTPEIITAGNTIIVEAARILQLPVIYAAIVEELKDQYVNNFDFPVKYIKRYMPSAMW